MSENIFDGRHLRDPLIGKKFDVLDQGFVILRDVMGKDQDVAEIARISYGQVSNPSKDADLIDHLMRHRHTSPFEMPVIRLQVKLPIFVERQWVRHRTCSMNEMSGRYREMPEEFYIPGIEVIRKQSKFNKQGRDEQVDEVNSKEFQRSTKARGEQCFEGYHQAIEDQVANELARIQLPLGTYTEKVWQMNLHNLLHFLKLRTDSHAQWEIQQYANVIEEIVAECFPMIHTSWKNHVKDAITFSADEMKLLARMLRKEYECDDTDKTGYEVIDEFIEHSGLSKTRRTEMRKKLGL
jgi:thymidylate synthase (FAD)